MEAPGLDGFIYTNTKRGRPPSLTITPPLSPLVCSVRLASSASFMDRSISLRLKVSTVPPPCLMMDGGDPQPPMVPGTDSLVGLQGHHCKWEPGLPVGLTWLSKYGLKE